MSFFADEHDARFAFDHFVLPSIEAAMNADIFNKKHMHIVIFNPGVQHVPGITQQRPPILLRHSIGKPNWEGPYDEYALAKAMISWRTGRSSREAKALWPHLFIEGDFPHSGAVNIDGIVAAASGPEGYFDEMIAGMAALALKGYACHAQAIYEKRDHTSPFLGQGDR
jgi:hypothetical protein